MTEVEFVGVLTGRRFRYDPMRSLEAPGLPGTAMLGHYRGVDVATGEAVYVRTVSALSDLDKPTVRRVRHAIKVARTSAIINCPTIVRLLNYEDRTQDGFEFRDDYTVVTSV